MLTRKLFKLSLLILALVIVNSSIVFGTEIKSKPHIKADGAILIDAQTGEILFELNAKKRMHPASLTKIMTAILAIEKGNIDNKVRIGETPARIYIGSTIKLKNGEIVSIGDLVKAALIVSANDAALAIGEYIGGNEALFLHWMNQKAYSLGAYDTKFINTNGYSKPNHLTTPYDLALISRYAMHNSRFAKLVASKEATITKLFYSNGKKREEEFPLKNTNKLLWHTSDFEIVGVKTGTTSRAGGCLVAAAKKNGHTIIAVVLHTGKRYQDSLNLFNYGFNNYQWNKLIGKGQVIGSCKVKKGIEKEVNIIADKSLYTISPIKQEKYNFKLKINFNKILQAPVPKGKKVGIAILYKDGKIFDQINIITTKAIAKGGFFD